MNAKEILPPLESVFQELFYRDEILFNLGAQGISEQSITFRLGFYLQHRFGSYDVDCEYNRRGSGLKTDEQVDLEWMMPDVIVHTRKKKENNLIVVEAKKAAQWAGGWPEIDQKLKAFTRNPGNYEYQLGMAWKIEASQNPANHVAVWFLGGEELCRTLVVDFASEVSEAIDSNRRRQGHAV